MTEESTVDTGAIVDRATVPSSAPTYAGKPIPFYPNRGLAVPAADPVDLLRTQEPLLARLQQASGFSYEDFDRLLRPVLNRYAAFVHLLPASENHHHWDIGGLLRHGLECGFYAARKCEGAVFALDFTPAQRKLLEPRYRLCAILGALMHDLGKPLFDVGAIDETGELQWDPHVEPLNAWLSANALPHYFITWRQGPRGMKHEAFTTAAVYRIVPEATMRWIADGGSQKPFSEMLLAMTTRHDDKNVLVEIIKHADQASVSRDILASRQRLAETGQGGLRSLAARLVRSVHDKLLSGEWRLNRVGDPVWYTEEGIVAVFPEITRQMIEAIRATGDQALAYDSMQVLEILADYGFTTPNPLPNGNFRHTWEAKLTGEDRGKPFVHKVQVIRFSAETIVPAVTVLPPPVKVEWSDVAATQAAAGAAPSGPAALSTSTPAEAPQAATTADAEQEPIVLAIGTLPPKPSLAESDVQKPANAEPMAATPAAAPVQAADVGHQQTYPHLYPADMLANVELPEVVGGAPTDPMLPPSPEATGQGELEISAPSPADDPNHAYFRDTSREKDYADEKRDMAREALRSQWPPATAEEANAWLNTKRPLGIYFQDIAEAVRAGKLRRGEAVFVVDERINFKFPTVFQDLGADVYELRTEFSEFGWLERDPATPTSQNVSVAHPQTQQPVPCIRLTKDMSDVFMLLAGSALASASADSGGTAAIHGLGPYLSADDIGAWTAMHFAGDPNPELAAVLRHALWRFAGDRHAQGNDDLAATLQSLDERVMKATITDFVAQHQGLTRSVVHLLCAGKANAMLVVTQYANAGSGRWEVRCNPGYDQAQDAAIAASVRERNYKEQAR
ncbi:TraI domain-containing protein (plasmid) [Xanthomonas citri pv. citri]|uniref:MobH family relaxase n=1 Tax=Xanthomonas citri TaxID=346 RepID=UPI001931B628|nr:MobH family relaxase [Xanthomonas citri]QRD62740.1 TraI domain-containing protein [Xanthomonas citri pv. citri]QRD71680.1 TraI domain-containing protein [Xanthomonas citri pv. citri]